MWRGVWGSGACRTADRMRCRSARLVTLPPRPPIPALPFLSSPAPSSSHTAGRRTHWRVRDSHSRRRDSTRFHLMRLDSPQAVARDSHSVWAACVSGAGIFNWASELRYFTDTGGQGTSRTRNRTRETRPDRTHEIRRDRTRETQTDEICSARRAFSLAFSSSLLGRRAAAAAQAVARADHRPAAAPCRPLLGQPRPSAPRHCLRLLARRPRRQHDGAIAAHPGPARSPFTTTAPLHR
jgi:hypothetical protein